MYSVKTITMQFFCFLTLFVLVKATANEASCKREVFLANEMIQLAYNKNDFIVGNNSRTNGLEHVIENMVNDEKYYESFAEMNMMIASPDKFCLLKHIPGMEGQHPFTRCVFYQDMMQFDIHSTLKIDRAIAAFGQNFGSLDLKDLADQRRSLVKTALKNIFKRKLGPMYNQFMTELEIRDTKNLVGSNLATLAEKRRGNGTSLESKIRRRVGNDNPKVVEDQNRSPLHVFLSRLCRLTGLYMSTQFPNPCIQELSIDAHNYTCTLKDGSKEIIFTIEKELMKNSSIPGVL
ncbi:uncharacterized protein LOC126845262 isoform X3 [Adelges cooleyi]|uniref:uncharacterized protein LOC126845262 isoform X3 n=1 Tax=Adelges cooleyi TaxID=133065 RepID=UPI00217FA330|nr:uncharacterized protein LOC126845262 isoform X3 [Adelges cooleyi]